MGSDRHYPEEAPSHFARVDGSRWGKVGKQKIKDTGPLNKKRTETCDDEFVAAAQDFIKRQERAGKPWFVWLNFTHMHCFTHTKPKSKGQAGRWQSNYHDTMIDHDKNVGQMLDFLDKAGAGSAAAFQGAYALLHAFAKFDEGNVRPINAYQPHAWVLEVDDHVGRQ